MDRSVILIRSRAIDSAVFKLADTLFKNGFKVQLLIWDRQNNLNEEDYPYEIHKFNLKAPYDKLMAILYFPIWWIYEFYFLLCHSVDVIHACDLDTLWPAIIVKFIKRTLLFYIIYDFYGDNIVESSSIRQLVTFLEKLGIKYTDTLFLVDESRYEQVKGSKIKKIVYIYNSPHDIYPKKEIKNFNDDNFTIFYAGLLDNSRGIKYIINAINGLNFVRLIIAGMGNCKNFIEETSKSQRNVNYVGWLDHDEVLEMSLRADVLFAFYDPIIPNNKYASPNKLFESMMCGKPIIVSDDSSMSSIVREEKCGIVVPYGNHEALKKAIIKLSTSPDFCKVLGLNGRKAYVDKYDWQIMENKLLNAYKI